MPLVLFTAEGKEMSGYLYSDVTGVSYEYPARYARLMVPGEPFVYHVPGKYAGRGIIGPISASLIPGNFVCEILDYEPFDSPVSLKSSDGVYFEATPNNPNVFWQQGVRPLSWPAFQAILGTATTANWESPAPGGYATPADAQAVERASVSAAIKWLKSEYDGESVLEMPHSNPGFDVLVGDPTKPLKYAEVKGTRSSKPSFWMSEGERQFSLANAPKYLLVVVSEIDLQGNVAPRLRVRHGAVNKDGILLEVNQWRGTLTGTPAIS